eukprot:14149216-Alexandrium_andersonii.AAC.1
MLEGEPAAIGAGLGSLRSDGVPLSVRGLHSAPLRATLTSAQCLARGLMLCVVASTAVVVGRMQHAPPLPVSLSGAVVCAAPLAPRLFFLCLHATQLGDAARAWGLCVSVTAQEAHTARCFTPALAGLRVPPTVTLVDPRVRAPLGRQVCASVSILGGGDNLLERLCVQESWRK